MDLEALRGFLAVVETGSFVAAATSLRWARATLRRRVDELEASAGVALLLRHGQGAVPTEAGRVLAARGAEILAEANALLSSVREVGATPSGCVRLALPVGLPSAVVLPMYVMLRERFPLLRFEVSPSPDPLQALLHDVDIAVCFGDSPLEGPWVTPSLLQLPVRLLASRAWLQQHALPSSIDEVAAQELLVWQAPGASSQALPLRHGGSLAIVPTLVSADIDFLRICATHGQGLVFAPDAALDDDLDQWTPVLPDVIGCQRALRVVLPAVQVDVPRIRAVLEVAELLLPSVPSVPAASSTS